MTKKCVFCGKKPVRKSNEHVLPQWLIEMTGDPARPFNLWFDLEKMTLRQFPAKEFKFPACEECNQLYSSLEKRAKVAVTKALHGEPLDESNMDLLLDWLDKVRIGLWLGFRYLNKNVPEIEPNFYISNRLGVADRFVHFYKIPSAEKRINFDGVHSPLFGLMPSCFGLRINNLYFFNASTAFLFSRRAGFPYLQDSYQTMDGTIVGQEVIGTNRIMTPLVRRRFLENRISVYQPISPLLSDKALITDYVANNTLPGNSTRGGLIVYKDSKVFWMKKGTGIAIEDVERKVPPMVFAYSLAAQVFRYQKDLLSASMKIRIEDISERKQHEKRVKDWIVLHNKIVELMYAEAKRATGVSVEP